MQFSLDDIVQREHHYAIVDEVDSILIDEARTPLIISGRDRSAESRAPLYEKVNRIIPRLKRAATIVEGKLSEIEEHGGGRLHRRREVASTVSLTEQGVAYCERLLGVENLSDPTHIEIAHHIHQALKAHHIFHKDVDYVVKDLETVDDQGRASLQPQVIIVDEFTGRMMPGRRWSDGLHEAVEAKEGLKIARENQTLATITLQNYFRMYDKLSGMTGTAATEAEEFAKIYELDVTVIPTNRTLGRVELPGRGLQDRAREVRRGRRRDRGAPRQGPAGAGGHRLHREVGAALQAAQEARDPPPGAQRQVPRARGRDRGPGRAREGGHHRHQHGRPRHRHPARRQPRFPGQGAADARRGSTPPPRPRRRARPSWAEAKKSTEPEHERVVALGGLHIIGTERHESRRIDNQLRGRSGRQGDPGSSRFYLSLEDDLLRIFGSERIQRIMDRLGMEEGEPIEHKLVTRAIGTAQKRVETRNFEIRKHLLEYDDVMNKQREIVYGLRREVLEGESQEETMLEWIGELAGSVVERYAAADAHPEDWDLVGLNEALHRQFDFRLPTAALEDVSRAAGPDRSRSRRRRSATTASASS